MARSWPLRPAPVPVAEPLAAGPTAAGGSCSSSVSSKLLKEEVGGAPGRFLGPAPEPVARRGARDGERAGAPRRGGDGDPELQPAPRARVRHYLALRLSFDWSNGAAPRPPPPPSSPAPPRPVRGGRLKGTPRLSLAPARPPGLPGLPELPGPARPVPPVAGGPRRGPASPAPVPGATQLDPRATPAALRGDLAPAPGNPASRALRVNPGCARRGGS